MNNFNITHYHRKITIFHKSALAYADKLNWSVFPLYSIQGGHCTCGNRECKSPGKHPRIAGGFKSATTNKQQIDEWWSRWPFSNIGIATGKVNGIIVLDIDPRNGGSESFEELTSEYGSIPETVEALSGGEGRHILFQYPGVVNAGKSIKPGIDIKADGGYIVGAPSLHISGRRYEWELSSHPLQVRFAECPEWLLGLIKEDNPAHAKRPASYWQDAFKGVEQGQRNTVATQLAGYFLRKYVDPLITWEILQMWNNRNNPPLGKDELHNIINSVAGKELARRRKGKRVGG